MHYPQPQLVIHCTGLAGDVGRIVGTLGVAHQSIPGRESPVEPLESWLDMV